MSTGLQNRAETPHTLLKDLNSLLTCTLCRGYLIDATTLVDCLHVFCRSCILRYFENFKLGCPTCNVVYKKKYNTCFRSDSIIQALVYKLVPGLYSKEVQRREDFYRSTGVRAGSSCSEDSVLGELNDVHEVWVLSTCGDQNQYLAPEDPISLSLEYYKPQLDQTLSDTKSTNNEDSTKAKGDENSISDLNNSANLSGEKTQSCDTNDNNTNNKDFDEFMDKKKCDRRYLQCPAAVTMSLLQKFTRMKHALSTEHRVDIIYSGEVLPDHFSLMDVAYTFKWRRTKPMRFFFRIFIPAKIQPIKIISTGGKQLQVVPAYQRVDATKDKDSSSSCSSSTSSSLDAEMQNYKNKERLMANLELQSKKSLLKKDDNCIFEYEEPDKEEIREFAEKRDREWALQKKLDEEEKEKHRNSKKRKKNKHSKSNLLYKKRKLHAEITSSESLQNEESLKLKVKLTPHNGYKHKHHKNTTSVTELPKVLELSSKEKLLQMRQVRHKHISTEDKSKQQNTQESESTNVEPDSASTTKEIFMQKYPTVQIERNEQAERHVKKTFLQSIAENLDGHKNRPTTQNTYLGKSQIAKTLEQKIANLHQQCTTVEPAKTDPPTKPEKKVTFSIDSPRVMNSYPSGFTVSKIEAGKKRTQDVPDKRPSLEITLINPEKPKSDYKPVAKRPPPPTIPLEKIKKSINRVSGMSIIPKIPEKRDNTGALDLSKPNKISDSDIKADLHKLLNGLGKTSERDGNMQLVNLQMLSKVATEYPNINKNLNANKRSSLPNLQTLKIPVPQNATPKSNLAKLPKLNEINPTQFRMPSTQMRNMRPNQNQSIRNIPNPSLLVRQQNQNRLNSLNQVQSTSSEATKVESTNEKPEEKGLPDSSSVTS
ncbi:hypothetical protein FQA39_LY18421 [Lamprigera yunnana]|nr:hypothetical protein FQA39_LY18421 [Lamprigera yunnana]